MLQAAADNLVVPFGEVAVAGLPDSGDRQVPPYGVLAFWLGGGGRARDRRRRARAAAPPDAC
jgi:hypothetical protein